MRTDSPVDIGKRKIGKAVVPGRAVRDQRVLSFRAPTFGDPMPLEDDMRHTRLTQMLAHGQPCPAATDNERVNRFHGHCRLSHPRFDADPCT
jgi:hypothetical protein